MTNEFVMSELRKLQLLKFFPSDPVAIAALAELVGEWCSAEHTTPDTPEQRCTKLIRGALRDSRQWECPGALREQFVALYPKQTRRSSDGVDPAAEYVAPWEQSYERCVCP
jgi:hypothetical protein